MNSFLPVKKSHIKLGIGFAGIAAAFTLFGCESGVSNQDTENALVTAAYNSNQCATAGALKGFYGAYTWNSPSNYSTSCNAVDDTALGTANYTGYGSTAKNLPVTKAACEATQITSLFYTRSTNGTNFGFALQKTESHTGVWRVVFAAGVCRLASTSFPPQNRAVLVRNATTVRQPSGTSFITLPFSAYLK